MKLDAKNMQIDTDSDKQYLAAKLSLISPASTACPTSPSTPSTDDDEEDKLHYTGLPKLPPPRHDLMRAQFRKGCVIVTSCIAAALFVSHASVFFSEIDELLKSILLSTVWAEAGAAIFCLMMIKRVDPGVMQRGERRCTPVPVGPVQDMLLEGRLLSPGLTNIISAANGSYCVRCFMWRKPEEKAHHCSCCNRCVRDFDHHCKLLGRCIAGKGMSGNMGYFKGLKCMGWLGFATALATLFLAVSSRIGWQQTLFCAARLLLGGSIAVGLVVLIGWVSISYMFGAEKSEGDHYGLM